MAAHGWGQAGSLVDWLLAEGERFDFFQAAAILERCRPHRKVDYRSSVDLDYAGTAIRSVKVGAGASAEPTVEIEASFLGLAGPSGPLPLAFAEIVARQSRRGDTALRD